MLFNKILLILFLFSISTFGKNLFKAKTVFKKPVLVGVTSYTSTADDSAILELKSTTQGFLPPRMTTTQRDAIASPVTGLMIFNTTTDQFENYASSAWIAVGSKPLGAYIKNEALEYEYGDWITSVSDDATGSTTITVDAGIFSHVPICMVTSGVTYYNCIYDYENSSSTSLKIYCFETSSFSLRDAHYSIDCKGPK